MLWHPQPREGHRKRSALSSPCPPLSSAVAPQNLHVLEAGQSEMHCRQESAIPDIDSSGGSFVGAPRHAVGEEHLALRSFHDMPRGIYETEKEKNSNKTWQPHTCVPGKAAGNCDENMAGTCGGSASKPYECRRLVTVGVKRCSANFCSKPPALPEHRHRNRLNIPFHGFSTGLSPCLYIEQ